MLANPDYNFGSAITKSDTVNITCPAGRIVTDAIYVGGTGNIVWVLATGDTVTLDGAVAGTILPIMALRVNSTSTTATNLVGLWSV
jgi:hypothetical protein